MNGTVSELFFTTAQQERYVAKGEQITRSAERRSTSEQSRILASAQDVALRAMHEIEATYNGGNIIAQEDGVVSTAVAKRGDVLKPGEYLTELFFGDRHVLAYVETGALYRLAINDRVRVSNGFRSVGGTVVDISPVAVELPREFQKIFRPVGREQVAKVVLDEPNLFPLLSKVRVTGEGYVPGEAWFEEKIVPTYKRYLSPTFEGFEEYAREKATSLWRRLRPLLP